MSTVKSVPASHCTQNKQASGTASTAKAVVLISGEDSFHPSRKATR